MLCDVILQVVNSLYLFIPCGSINSGFLAKFSESEDLICYFVVVLFAVGFLNELLLQGHKLFVNAVNGSCLRSSNDCGNVKLELCLIIAFVTKHLIDGFDNDILKNQLIYGSSVAFKPGGLQPTDAAPDNGFDASVVPVEPSEHFTAFSADDDLGEAVVATIASFLAVGTGFYHSPADKFFLYLQVNVLWNNGFVVAFYIVLWNKTVIFNSGLVKKVGGVGLLKQGITDVFLVSENFVDGACVPLFSSGTGKDTVTLQACSNLVHTETF